MVLKNFNTPLPFFPPTVDRLSRMFKVKTTVTHPSVAPGTEQSRRELALLRGPSLGHGGIYTPRCWA